jgi:asparagine synthase (glutamine-hydrolysing)
MCGICGVVQIGGAPRRVIAPDVLDWMTDVMAHRGPNDRGTYASGGIALGVRRLSIVDVEGGHQPFSSEDGNVWAIQNGELYNHVALRAELEEDGHRFTSRCDTEVIPHLYERDGAGFPQRLRGKFGLAVWDARRRRAVVARDRLGVKPLYYAQAGDLVVFASELKSLLASGLVRATLDYEAIDAFLGFGFVPGPRTPLSGVQKLLPGHVLIVDADGPRVQQYWSFPRPEPDSPPLKLDEYAEGFRAELEEAVRLRLMSDVPLGAMLSGGLDSSLIVALMARNMSEPVKTFSVGFAEDAETNELADARLVASALGADHHELELSFAGQEVDLAELVWHLDEPLADLSALGFLALSELAARHVTVALAGQGADELFGGYKKHRAAAVVGSWQRLPRPLRGAGTRLALCGPKRVRRAARTLAAGDPADRLVAMSGKLDEDLRARLLRGSLAQLDGNASRRAVLARLDGLPDDPLPSTLYVDGQLALVDDMLHYFDRSSMAHSLEVRVPFLDHHVVEYCARIPAGFKVRRLTTKYVLKRSARGLIPDQIIDKRKIGFFNRPVEDWFRAQTRGAISDYLLAPRPAYAEILDPRVVHELVESHAAGTGTAHPHLLLSILMLEIWLSSFLPRALRPAAPARERVAVPAR